MFDDPKKELRRLEEQLLQEEDDGWLEDLAQAHALLERENRQRDPDATQVFQPPVRNFANGYGARTPEYREEYAYEEDDWYANEPPAPALREKPIGPLVLIALLEMAGIVGIVLYWLYMLL